MRDKIQQAFGFAPDEIIPDGSIHRFSTRDQPQDKAGYYCFFDHGDGFQAGFFGDWRSGHFETWHNHNGEKLSPDLIQGISEAKKKGQQERDRQAREAAEKARGIWEAAKPAQDHQYLTRKGIKPHNARLDSYGNLILPVMDMQGQINSLQIIKPDGEKLFLTGGKIKGHFCPLRGSDENGSVYIAEGFATAATVYEALEGTKTVLTAFNAGNLQPVAQVVRVKYPDRKVVIAADFDHRTDGNPGLTKAREAAQAVNALLAWPEFAPDDPGTDFNDLAQATGLDAVKTRLEFAILESEPEKTDHFQKIRPVTIYDFLKKKFPPRQNILDPWLPGQGLVMVYAYRGVGKTYFALSVGYAVATGGKFLTWTAKYPSGVLYIDGEMPGPVMQERLSMIVASSDLEPQAPFILLTPDLQPEGMPRLDTTEGQATVESILTPEIKFIIVDNISTLTSARENEADGWTPIQAWALRQRAKGRAVMFIHHSGKTGTQRGTSRREDVLDTVLSLKRPIDYEPSMGAVFEIHFEKARGLYGDDVSPIEARLSTDESGNMAWLTRPVEACNYDRVVELLKDGLTQKEIAQELNLNKSTVSRHAKRSRQEGLISNIGGQGNG